MDTNYKTNQSTDRIDEQILLIAESILAGTQDETEGRWKIAGLLTLADIPSNIVNRGSHSSMAPQLKEDVAEKLRQLIEKKVRQTEPAYLDLTRMVRERSSACGWARSLARTAAGSAVRDVVAPQRHSTIVNPQADREESLGGDTLAFHQASVEFDVEALDTPDIDEEVAVAAERQFTEDARGTRDTGRLRIAAKALLETFQLPNAIRPEDHIDREFLRQIIDSDVNAARESARSLHALIVDVQTARQASTDERLLAMWDDYTIAQLEMIVDKPARFAQTIAQAALSLEPKPSRNAVGAATAAIRRLVPNTPQWGQLSRDLVASYMASETEPLSAFDVKKSLSDEEMAKRFEDSMAYRERAEVFATSADAHLGATATDVFENVASIMHSCVSGTPVTVNITAEVRQDA